MEGSIRSGIDSMAKVKRDLDSGYEVDRPRHARGFALAGVREGRDVEQRMAPVDARALGREVKAALVLAI
jgi:hypothetical protein